MSATESGGAAAAVAPVADTISATDDNELMDTDDLRDSDEEDSIIGCSDNGSSAVATPVADGVQ